MAILGIYVRFQGGTTPKFNTSPHEKGLGLFVLFMSIKFPGSIFSHPKIDTAKVSSEYPTIETSESFLFLHPRW